MVETTIREAIDESVDKQFERMQKQIVRFARDPRRVSEGGGVILRAHESFTLDDEHSEGRLYLVTSNPDSKKALLIAFANVTLMKEAVKKPDESCAYLLNDIGTLTELGLEPCSAQTRLYIQRETHPQVHDRFSPGVGEMWGSADYDPAKTGLRRALGIEQRIGFKEIGSTEIVLVASFDARVQTRFDRDPPVATHRSYLSDRTVLGLEPAKFGSQVLDQVVKRDATMQDLTDVKAAFDVAKYLRIDIDPIAEHVDYSRCLDGMMKRLFTTPEDVQG